MKRFITTLLSLLMVVLVKAQETSIEINVNGAAADTGYLWKATLLLVFTIVIIAIVVRTFRGKANI